MDLSIAKIENLFRESGAGLTDDQINFIINDLTDNQGVNVIDPDNVETTFIVMGMFLERPVNVSVDDIIHYIAGIEISSTDKGKTIGGHKITKYDENNKYLTPIFTQEDVDEKKTIGGYDITEDDVGKPPFPVIVTEEDVGKTIGDDFTITRHYIGRWLDGVLILTEDVGKTIGGVTLTNNMVDYSIAGVNVENIGFDAPVFRANQFNYSITIANLGGDFEIEEGTIKCNRCGGLEVSITFKQTKSGDEPASIDWVCVKCNQKGRIGG